MTAVTCTIAGEDHCLAAEHPLGITLVVTTLGKVVDFAVAAGIDQRNILAIPASRSDVR